MFQNFTRKVLNILDSEIIDRIIDLQHGDERKLRLPLSFSVKTNLT